MTSKRKAIPGDSVRIIKEGDQFEKKEVTVVAVNYENGFIIVGIPADKIPKNQRHKYFVNSKGYVPFTYTEDEVELIGTKTIFYK